MREGKAMRDWRGWRNEGQEERTSGRKELESKNKTRKKGRRVRREHLLLRRRRLFARTVFSLPLIRRPGTEGTENGPEKGSR